MVIRAVTMEGPTEGMRQHEEAWERGTYKRDLEVVMEETRDRLQAMLRQEAEQYFPCSDYLSRTVGSAVAGRDGGANANDTVCEAWRRKLCEWCYSVVDHFKFDREVVSFAIHFLDQTIAAKTNVSHDGFCHLTQRQYQLYAVTSLYLAIKLHAEVDDRSPEAIRRKLRISAYVELSRGLFSEELIEQTEFDILNTLNWRVSPPSSLSYIAKMLLLCPRWGDSGSTSTEVRRRVMEVTFDIARYLTELSVCVSSFAFSHRTSLTSYTAILYALDHLPPNLALPRGVRMDFTQVLIETTGFRPSDREVHQVYYQFDDMCPGLFSNQDPQQHSFVNADNNDDADHAAQHERSSPVSVMAGPNGFCNSGNNAAAYGVSSRCKTQRKRSRSFDEGPNANAEQ